MWRRGFLLAGLMIAALSGGTALACSCVRYHSAEEQWATTDVAFVGTVVGQEQYKDASGARLMRTRFRVARTLKGQALAVRAIGHDPDRVGSCGPSFTNGETVVVFARNTPDGLWTSSCSEPQYPLAEFERLAARRK